MRGGSPPLGSRPWAAVSPELFETPAPGVTRGVRGQRVRPSAIRPWASTSLLLRHSVIRHWPQQTPVSEVSSLRDRPPARVLKPYAAAIPKCNFENASPPSELYTPFVRTNRRSDMAQPGGDPWRGDGTGVECFNDVPAVQPAVARLGSIARLTEELEGRLEPQVYCHRPGTDRRAAAPAHSE
jgi:hypothetical protein